MKHGARAGGTAGTANSGCPNPMPDGMLVCSGFEEGGYGEPGYVLHTDYDQEDATGTEFIETCEGRTAHSGNHFWRRNYYAGVYDPCLDSTPLAHPVDQSRSIVDENGAFSHLSILSNWGGGSNTPHGEMAVEIDDIEVWDRIPTL